MKIIVTGSRTFDDYSLLKRKMNKFTSLLNYKRLEIITGMTEDDKEYGEEGAGYLARWWCGQNGIRHTEFKLKWKRIKGIQRMYLRCGKMVEYVGDKGVLIAFWNGFSFGTSDIIRECVKRELKIRVVRYKED